MTFLQIGSPKQKSLVIIVCAIIDCLHLAHGKLRIYRFNSSIRRRGSSKEEDLTGDGGTVVAA
jgi:hypothetical protein